MTVDGRNAVYDQASSASRAGDRAEAAAAGRTAGRRGGRVRRVPRALRLPRRAQLAGERPGGRHHEPAPHGAVVVPGQRPPPRQGAGRHPRHRPAAQAGRGQRTAGRHARSAATSRRTTGRPTSRWCRTWRSSPPGASRSSQGTHDGLPWLVAVSRRLPQELRKDSLALMERTPDIVAWLEDPARRLPVQPDGRPGDQPPARLRAGEPDAADLPADRAQHGRARARPPVVRRLRGRARVARHLAQRRLRLVHGAGLRRGARRRGRPAVAGVDVGGVRRRRPVLEAGHRRSRRPPDLRPGGLPARLR